MIMIKNDWSDEFKDSVINTIATRKSSIKLDPDIHKRGSRFKNNKCIFMGAAHYLLLERETNGFRNNITLEVEASPIKYIENAVDNAILEAASIDYDIWEKCYQGKRVK